MLVKPPDHLFPTNMIVVIFNNLINKFSKTLEIQNTQISRPDFPGSKVWAE